MAIPNQFTACEEYHGWIIAMYQGRYVGFKGNRATPTALTRADVRGYVDQRI